MKKTAATLFAGLCVLIFGSCTKNSTSLDDPDPFTHYVIPQGEHSSNHSAYETVHQAELEFLVRFDSSAVYSTVDPHNQKDVNKLYGFADNNEHHHVSSARIGWRWTENALRLFGYVYNNGELTYEELGAISIGEDHNCSITTTRGYYIFNVNGSILRMPRISADTIANGYKLFPYFGGNETAPHDIRILIREM